MNIYKRIILFIALISFLLSCNNSNNGNFNLNANYIKNLKHVNTKYQNIKQQNIKQKNIKQQNIKYQSIKHQNIKYENIKYEIEILENTLNENIISEYVIFEVSTKEDLENNIKNKEYSDDFWENIDWKPILSKFAIGTSVIIITGVLSIATINTPLHVVFLYSFKGSIEGALIGATTGAAINSVSQIVLNGGKIDGWQEYALEGAADGYMYGAITGAITGAKGGYKEFKYRKQYIKNRPSYRKGVVEEVWENAKGPDGLVRDPNTGDIINWTKGTPREGVWDMGHIAGEEYRKMVHRFRSGKITKKEFFDWYNNPKNYYPELPSNNRSHRFEVK